MWNTISAALYDGTIVAVKVMSSGSTRDDFRRAVRLISQWWKDYDGLDKTLHGWPAYIRIAADLVNSCIFVERDGKTYLAVSAWSTNPEIHEQTVVSCKLVLSDPPLDSSYDRSQFSQKRGTRETRRQFLYALNHKHFIGTIDEAGNFQEHEEPTVHPSF